MMNEQFDTFPVNIFGMLGKIEKEDFCFRCSYYRIWYNGQVIQQGNGGFDVIGIVANDILHVDVMTGDLAEYTVSSFEMGKISLNRDRVLWSAFTNSPLQKMPTALSLFFKKGVLARVSITIDSPQMLIEMDGYPLETNNERIDKKKYLIISIESNNTVTDGQALIVKANPVSKIDDFDFLLENFGSKYYSYSTQEIPETEYFFLPCSEKLLNELLYITRQSGDDRFWEPDMDSFYNARLQIKEGTIVKMHKSWDFRTRRMNNR